MLHRAFAFVVAATLALAGCTSLQLVEPYDPAIEAGLDSYSKAMTTFLKKQEQDPGAPSTLFSSADSKTFYQESEATLSNAVLHAEALSNAAHCAPKFADALGLTQVIANITSAGQQIASDETAEFSVTLQDGSCTVVALKAVRANNQILEALHRKNGHLRPGVAALVRGLLEDSIRIALRIEKAKKP